MCAWLAYNLEADQGAALRKGEAGPVGARKIEIGFRVQG